MPTRRNRFADLEALEHQVRLEANASAKRRKRARVGHRKVGFGFAITGLRDVLVACGKLEEAHDRQAFLAGLDDLLASKKASDVSNDPEVLVALAEALRVYARDVQLSKALDAQIAPTIEASIQCFDKAASLLPSDDKDRLAWIRAHRGAARMMSYWLALADDPSATRDNPVALAKHDDLFELCANDFVEACKLRKEPYSWAIQFHAFLHALRGANGDSAKAIALLELLGEDKLMQPTIQRSIAMLLSYNAVEGAGDRSSRENAAKASIAAAMNAQKVDQDEFLGPYSGAVSSWSLFEMSRTHDQPAGDDERYRNARGAVEMAEIRAKNAISQALVALVGLTFIRGKLADAGRSNERFDQKEKDLKEAEFDNAAKDSNALQEVIRLSRFRDIESRAMVIRDPIWETIRKDPNFADFCRPGFDVLRGYTRDAKSDAEKGSKRFP